MPKLVYVTTFFPFPPTGGGKLRVSNLIRGLSSEFEIHLVALCRPHDQEQIDIDAAYQAGCTSVHTVLHSNSRLTGVLGVMQGIPYEIALMRNREMAERVREVCESIGPDVFWCSRLASVQYLPDDSFALRVLDQHDLSRHLWTLMSQSASGFLVNFISRLNLSIVKRYEEHEYPQFDAVISVAEDEMVMTRSFIPPGTSTVVIPNGCDVEHYEPTDISPRDKSVVLVGSMGQIRNIEAAELLVNEIMPEVWKRVPDAMVQIVGRDPSERVTVLAQDSRVTVTGFVEDDRPYLSNAAVVAAPYHNGSGVKHKVPIALAMGKPVVTTSNGVHGLNVSSDEHVLIRDKPKDFAEAVVQLLEDPDKAARLARNGRAFAMVELDWRQLSRQASDWVSELLTHYRKDKGLCG